MLCSYPTLSKAKHRIDQIKLQGAIIARVVHDQEVRNAKRTVVRQPMFNSKHFVAHGRKNQNPGLVEFGDERRVKFRCGDAMIAPTNAAASTACGRKKTLPPEKSAFVGFENLRPAE